MTDNITEETTPFLTTWCGGSEGNTKCNYNCKLCLIFSGKAELIKADDKCLKLTYRIKAGA
jgi:hypothetical protein